MDPSSMFRVNLIQSDFSVSFKEAFVASKFLHRNEFVVSKACQVGCSQSEVMNLIERREKIVLQTFNQDFTSAVIEFYGHQEDAEYYKVSQARNLVKCLKQSSDETPRYVITNIQRWCYIELQYPCQEFLHLSTMDYKTHIQSCSETNMEIHDIKKSLKILTEKSNKILTKIESNNEQDHQEIKEIGESPVNVELKCSKELSSSSGLDKYILYKNFQEILKKRRSNNDWIERVKKIKVTGISEKYNQDIVKRLISGPGDVASFMRVLATKIYGKQKLAKTLMGRNGKAYRVNAKDGERSNVFSLDEEKKIADILTSIDDKLFESDQAWSILVKLPINQAGRDAAKSLKKKSFYQESFRC